ncbi:ctpA [Symbiodinium natans]|uniref:CtpA protein n=1 Tax=Symbiodinium natans TaxID=878477 RepID=A0A812IMS8_9DINO|nr:ctpA [Symbiodinium natans]
MSRARRCRNLVGLALVLFLAWVGARPFVLLGLVGELCCRVRIWRFVRLSSSLLSLEASDTESVEAAWGFVKRNYFDQSFNHQDWEVAHQRYLERVKKGQRAESIVRDMIASLGDRYSRVIDAATFEQLMAFDPLGVGLVLARNDSKQVFVSSPPFGGSSAAKAGIKQGDIVDSINDMSFKEMSLLAVCDRVAQGDAAEVKLQLHPPGSSEVREVSLARPRQAKPLNEVESGVVTASNGHKIGYFRLRNVGARSAVDLRAALAKVRSAGAQELVIDLRGNPGGSFPAALEIAEIFLKPGAVAAQVQLPTSDSKPLRVGEGEGALQASMEPLAVLVDGGSASASEVLAVALRGNCRAPLLGSRTFGKAAVQGVFGLPNKEAVALTVARYSGPDGTRIEGGLEPDLSLPGPSLPMGLSVSGAAAELGLPLFQNNDYAALDVVASSKALQSCTNGGSEQLQ